MDLADVKDTVMNFPHPAKSEDESKSRAEKENEAVELIKKLSDDDIIKIMEVVKK